MAIVWKFRYASTNVTLEATGDATTEQWIAALSRDGEDVEENISLFIDDTSDNALATEIQLFDDLILRVKRYRENPSYETPVWLHAKLANESGERRAPVKQLSYTLTSGAFTPDARQSKQSMQLSVVRGGYWEETTGTQYGGLAAVAGASVEWDYTGAVTVAAHDVVGDVPARMGVLLFVNATEPLDKIYAGIRSADVRRITDYTSIWECEDGTNTARGADDAISEVDLSSPGSGSGAFVVGTPSASDTWEEYFSINIDDVYGLNVPSYYNAAFGTFLWLLRCKVGAASNTFQVQLRWGYEGMADADYVRGPIVEVTNTAWDYAEMGVQKIPPRDVKALTRATLNESFEGLVSVQVWVKRTLGASTLKLDCLCPIAVDEGYVILKEAATAVSDAIIFCQEPAGRAYGYSFLSTASVVKICTLDSGAFALPPGDGRVDLVYTRDGSSVLTDTIEVSSTVLTLYYERWRTMRGSE